MYAIACQQDRAIVFGQVFARILAAFLFVGLGMCLFAAEAVAVLGGDRYAPAVWFVAPVVLACFCQCASSLMDAGLYVKRRTGLKLAVSMATALVMVTLYVVLIPTWGSKGAALATLAGFAFLAVATFAVSQRVFPVRYPWPRLAGLVGLAGGLWLAAQVLPEGGWSLAARVGLWLAAPALAWFVGLVAPQEKQAVLEAIGGRRQASPDGASPAGRAAVLLR